MQRQAGEQHQARQKAAARRSAPKNAAYRCPRQVGEGARPYAAGTLPRTMVATAERTNGEQEERYRRMVYGRITLEEPHEAYRAPRHHGIFSAHARINRQVVLAMPRRHAAPPSTRFLLLLPVQKSKMYGGVRIRHQVSGTARGSSGARKGACRTEDGSSREKDR